MPIPFIMPKMDMDQEVVTIVEWLKKDGEKIVKGEPVVTVETDKITSDIEAPESGVLAGILYHENEEAPVTKVVAYILADGESAADLPDAKVESVTADSKTSQPHATEPQTQAAIPATPLAEKMAASMRVDLGKVPASGEKITKADVESYVSSHKNQEHRVTTPATPAARMTAVKAGISLDTVSGSGPNGRVQAADVLQAESLASAATVHAVPEALMPKPETALSGTSIPMVGKRKRIAERLTASYQSAPHIYLTVEVDMSSAEASRKRLNMLAEKQGKPSISVTAYLIKMTAWALKRHPYLNASLTDDKIQFWEDVNVGVATALEEGLIVPVVHRANRMGMSEINERMRYLSKQARSGSLTREEVDGGTFTISNLGMYGIQSFTAIINPPQSAILAVGTLTRKPVVVDEDDTLEVRPMMTMTLSADHRIVDGAVAAAFLADLVKALEAPDLTLY